MFPNRTKQTKKLASFMSSLQRDNLYWHERFALLTVIPFIVKLLL